MSNKEEERNDYYEKPKWVVDNNYTNNYTNKNDNDNKNKGRHSKRNSNVNNLEDVKKKMIEKDKVVVSTGVNFYIKSNFFLSRILKV